MRESKFLKQSDVGRGALLTVSGCEQYNVSMQGEEPELKWCLKFEETDKPFVLHATNIQLCEQIFGSDDTDHWKGKKIVVYVDPNVSYGGKITGGVRVRAPKNVSTPSPAKVAKPLPTEPEDMTADDIPFAWLLPLVLPLLGLGSVVMG
jgi:hypothetical protein